MATFNHGKKIMVHNLTFDRRSYMNCWIFVVAFVLLFHVGHGLDVCSWSDISYPYEIGKGTHSVPEAGCRMKQWISVKVDVTIEGVSGTFRELQSNRVAKSWGTASSYHRHFNLQLPGKLTLNYLKLTWGEAGASNGGFISMVSGTLAINWVHFDGSKTTGLHANYGGCISVSNGKVTIKESTFEGFRASYGGALYVYKTSTPMTIESTTFKDNEATVRSISLGITYFKFIYYICFVFFLLNFFLLLLNTFLIFLSFPSVYHCSITVVLCLRTMVLLSPLLALLMS